MANVDCIYAAVSKRQMPSDEKRECIPCNSRWTRGGAIGIKISSDKSGWRKENEKKKKNT